MMKTTLVGVALCFVMVAGMLAGCASGPRAQRKPSVAVLISVPKGDRLSPAAVAEVHALLQPEIEHRGYVMAKNSRTADYVVQVRYPVDPRVVSRLVFVTAPPTVPFLSDRDWQPEVSGNKEYKRAIADMVTEPK